MKKISKPIITIFLSVILLLSTAVALFAGDDGDPLGLCIIAPKYKLIQYYKVDIR